MVNITKNYKRLAGEDYSINKIFQSNAYDWPGDWEGRALLAFCCHYEINGAEISCMHQMMQALKDHTNKDLYFGNVYDGTTVDEQQLSGHSWYLRGLIKYAKNFNSDFALEVAKSTVENLYLPVADKYKNYPLERKNYAGGVSGEVAGVINGWKLSSDVGCAFMCVDGLAHYYEYTKDDRVKALLDKILEVFLSADVVKYKFQTHTTLTCIRGILTLYKTTGEEKYLKTAIEKFDVYLNHGMTLTYENFNWFGREDTWTEPCAVVDSFLLATRLYKITKDKKYLTLSRRIWFNGLQFCQRDNGGAGPNSCVTASSPVLKPFMYEAPFCCSMRYAEGLLEQHKNKKFFSWKADSEVITDECGRKFKDDKLLVKQGEEVKLIFSCNTLKNMQQVTSTELEIIF